MRVEILDGKGEVEWTGEAPATADGEYGMKLPARFRRPEGCQVRLSIPGKIAGAWHALGTFVVTAPTLGAERFGPLIFSDSL